MTTHDEDRIKQLLQQALPPVELDAEPGRDLWPAFLRRLDAQVVTARPAATRLSVPWFDWALLTGLVVFAFSFPATIPIVLYYL